MTPTDKTYDLGKQYRIEIVREVTEVEKTRSFWEEMQWHPNADIDFYLMILGSRREVLRPHVVVLYDSGHPVRIMIGRIDEKKLDFRVGYRSLFKTKARLLSVIYGGILGEESVMTDEILVRELMDSLRRGEADAIFFNSLRLDSNVYRFARTLPGFFSRDYFTSTKLHWKTSLPRKVEHFYEGLNNRSRLLRQFRKLERDHSGEVEVIRFESPDEIDRFIQDAEKVARKTYHRGLGVGFKANGETLGRLRLASKHGWLRSYVLYIRSKPCAFLTGTVYGNTYYGEFTGYDPSHKRYSPGTYLFVKSMEDLCGEGIEDIDWGFGDAFYKRRFSDYYWKEASFYIFATRRTGLRLNILRAATMISSQLASRVLNQLNAAETVKRRWRKHLASN